MQRAVAAGPTRFRSKSGFRYTIEKFASQWCLQLMAFPGIAWMLIFCYIPLFWIVIAFKDYDIIKTVAESHWVGFKYFAEFFEDDNFLIVMKNTFGISMLRLAVGFPAPILFALLLNELRSLRFKKAVQTISYLPHFLSWVILGGISMAWVSENGFITSALAALRIIPEKTLMLAEPKYFWQIAVISDVWKELGWSAILYIAAIAGIDPELYEAATVDGAGRFRRMWHVTLPCIKATISILFILAVGSILNTNFDQILVLRNSLNRSASNVLDIYVYQMGIQSGRFSFATAIGLFRSVVSVVFLLLANVVTKKLTGSSLF
jgi:putative aldouronate transport system permease protein